MEGNKGGGSIELRKVSHTQKTLRRKTNKLEEREQRAETQSRKRSAGVMESQWNERRSEPCGASAGGLWEEITALIGKKREELMLVITYFFSFFVHFLLLLFQLLDVAFSASCSSFLSKFRGVSPSFSLCVFECMVI